MSASGAAPPGSSQHGAIALNIVQILERVDQEEIVRSTFQGFVESGLSILVHVVEHFSYHTGQIAYIVKSRKNIDLGFYRGRDLNQRG